MQMHEWSHDKKLKFVHQMTKLALEKIPHYDLGGAVAPTTLQGPTAATGTGGGVPNPNTGVAGTIGGILGINNNYSAGAANLTPGTNTAQLNNAYTTAQEGITNQGNLVTQTQPGVAQGLGTQSNLAGQFAAEAAGQGPNPAQAALNQSTGQNIAQTAALMASQRGAGANPGLVAEQAAQQGAATQQQAVGQAATLQAQQEIAAQQEAAQLAAQQVGQGAGAVQGQNNAAQNEQNILQGANTSLNNALVSQQSNINNVNAATAAGNQRTGSNIIGGVLGGASSALSSLFAEGGKVQPKMMAAGGYMPPTPLVVQPMAGGPQSFVGQWLNSPVTQSQGPQVANADIPIGPQTDLSQAAAGLGGKRSGQAAPGQDNDAVNQGIEDQATAEGNILPATGGLSDLGMMAAAKGGQVRRPLPPYGKGSLRLAASGGKVKAANEKQMPVSKSDSYANDKVPAKLTAGEVVIDLDTLHDSGPIGKMARQVAQHIAMRNQAKKQVK